jgi:hypothetical protein
VRLQSLLSAVAVLAVAHVAQAQGTVVEKVPGDPDEPTPADSSSEEKEMVTGSEDVEEQRKMTTEKEEGDAPPAAEQPASEEDDGPEEPERDEADFGHMMQIGLRGGIVLGYGTSFRYDNSPFCKEPDTTEDPPNEQQSICGFGKPPMTEIALSFAPLDSIEPYIFARLGFSREAKTDTEALKLFGIGARIYTMSDSPFKIFVEPAIAYETEGAAGNPEYCSNGCDDIAQNDPGTGGNADQYTTEYKKDVVFHIGIGPQYDFAKYVGLYLNGGIDVGILRSISAAFIGNLGLQVRIP